MRKIFNIVALLLLSICLPQQLFAQTISLSTFETGMKEGTKFVDTWEASPFNTNACSTEPEVIDNPYADHMNSTSKVLHYVRPYYAGDRNGVEIKLEQPLTLTTSTQYVHIFIHKPVSSRILLRGLDTTNNTFQFETLSISESRAGAWSDAVFAVKGSNYTIDRLVIYPDLDSSVKRLLGDIDIYIDEIVVNNSAESRSVSDYCSVGGNITSNRYISQITTTGASQNITITRNDRTSVYERYNEQSIISIPGGEFTLEFEQSSSGNTTNEAWIADVYADFNADKEFVSDGEYLGRVTGVASNDKFVFTKTITVPSNTSVGSCVLRIKLTDASDGTIAEGAYSSCDNVLDGYAINIPLELAEYAERPSIKITGKAEQSGWGAIKFKGMALGVTEIKVDSKTSLTVSATPNVGYEFKGWYNQSTGSLISTEPEFSFKPDYNMTLVAEFNEIPFCLPEFDAEAKYYLGKASITPEGQSTLYYVGSSTTAVNAVASNVQRHLILGGVNVKRGTSLSLYIEKAASSSAISEANVGMWADWDRNHQFDANEYLGDCNITSDSHTFSINVPSNAERGNIYLRMIMTDNELSATAPCENMGSGSAYDFMITIIPGDNERFSITAEPTTAGAATFTLSPEPDSDNKYAAGTNVQITCNPSEGWEFVQWFKDGMPYGETMTSNNPLPLTALYEDLNLTMKVEAKYPDYCDGTAPNNGSGVHYGITGGSVSINNIHAFTFSSGGNAITDLSSTCIAEVCPGDKIQLYVTGGNPHSAWAQGIAYFDWNMDGVWNTTSDEAYELYNNPGSENVINNHLTEITVPDDVAIGCFGVRLCAGEAPAYNSLGGGPCQARKTGTLLTFRINSSLPPASVPKMTLTEGDGCNVIVTNQDGDVVTSGDDITAGTTMNIRVTMTDENYMLESIKVNGVELAYTESEEGVYTVSFTVATSGARIVVETREKGYCEPTETMTRTDRTPSEGNDNRYLTEVKLTGAIYQNTPQEISVSGLSTDAHRRVYEDHTNQVLNCSPGDVLTPTLSFNGSWMHKYVFVDWNRNYTFDVGTEGDWNELVSFNYINSQNSAGASTTNNGSGALGTFVIPDNAHGEYRIRYKLDWDSTDPCGRFDANNSILNNGGGIVDFTINVYNPEAGLDDISTIPVVVVGGKGRIFITSSYDVNISVIDATVGYVCSRLENVSGDQEVQVPTGIYLVKIENEHTSNVKKVVVK